MEACAYRYVHYMAEQLTPQAMTIEEIRQASAEDEELTHIRDNRQKNKPHKLPSQYKHVSEELCITDQNILLRGNRIVLPAKLRQRAISLAHEDHAGGQNVHNASVQKCGGPRWTLKLKNTPKPVIPATLPVALNDQNQFVQLNLQKSPGYTWLSMSVDHFPPENR